MSPRPLLWLVLAMLCPVTGFSALLGNNFEISGPGCRFPDVAYGSVNRQYLVVWPDTTSCASSGAS
jgi:hypothetical protein